MRLEDAGVIWTYPKKCSPLDDVRIEFRWNDLKGQDVHFEISDARHRKYLEKTVVSEKEKAEITIKAGGQPGVHHVHVRVPCQDGREYHRHGGFRLEARTTIGTDTGEMDDLFEQLQEGLRQTIDVTNVNGMPVTYYKHADNTRQNLAYPAYAIAGLRYFIGDMKTMFEALFAFQYPDGSLPDHIYGDDYPCPLTGRRLRTCMADMETGAASTIYKGWQAHGDDQWIARFLPKVEEGLEYVTTAPMMFDGNHGVIKRPHTLDEWDIQFSPAGQGSDRASKESSFVIMQGDTSGMYDACHSLAHLYAALGNEDRANHWRMMREHCGRIGNKLFWDGVKYRHHIHLDPFDHGDFDEDQQLAMSNSWAITRGFADHEKAVSIINEYLRRLKETGDRFPWWSLQPGYPDKLKYFENQNQWTRGQGNYANGGLFPWVGGELCRGAFQHGLEDVAFGLLRDFHEVIKRDHGAVFTWYDLQGNAAISVPYNQTNYDTWGLFPWTQALIEELAGIQSKGKCFKEVLCSPKWPATKSREITATAHFPASDSYFSYSYQLSDDQIRLCFAGTGEKAFFRILSPKGRECKEVTIDGQNAPFTKETLETSSYIVMEAQIKGARELVCLFEE